MSRSPGGEPRQSADLPILDELGDRLYADHGRRESLRRRGRLAGAGVLAACAVVASVLLAARIGPAGEPRRVSASPPVQLLDGTSRAGRWRLVAMSSPAGPCVRLVVESAVAQAGNERCERVPRSSSALLVVEDERPGAGSIEGAALSAPASPARRARTGELRFVYGTAPRDVAAVEIRTADGRTRLVRTRSAPGGVGAVPDGLRYYVAVLDGARARVVDVAPTGSRNPDRVIRVPRRR